MRVQLVDPSAFTPPYDHALAGALARAGASVELLTSRFLYGPVPEPDGYTVSEGFYRRHGARGLDASGRRVVKLAEHLPGMLRNRDPAADVVHYQWLTLPTLDRHLLARKRPRLFTAHHVLHGSAGRLRRREARRLLESTDAVVALSEYARGRLREMLGVESLRIEVIPHGVLDYLTRLPEERALPAELAAVEGPVILHFGLLRPYKGLEVLLKAFREIEGAELWIVGMPRMAIEPLRELSERCPGTVRFVPRFVPDAELPAYFRRANLVVLPYTEAGDSGVLYAAMAFAKPLLMSRVGGLTEVAERHGAGLLVPPGDAAALAGAMAELIADSDRREALSRAAEAAARGPYSWEAVAGRHLDVYRELGAT